MQSVGLAEHEVAYDLLHDLYALVHEQQVVPYFEEREQDLDKVLNIFIRVNSGGTVLSYSDLLLSIATASWKGLDARKAIHGLVDELNAVRGGFQFSKDLVLKAGLMLSDIPSVAFRVTNFNARNMAALKDNWPSIAKALRIGVELLADFGLSAQSLAADSVLIPVAYYLYVRQLGDEYRNGVAFEDDRHVLRGWVIRSLIKSGVWGGGLDTLLMAIRTAIQDHGQARFPVAKIEEAMAIRGKFMRLTEDEIQHLLDSSYGDKRTFALLSLLYPHCDLRNAFHIDHIFPCAAFSTASLRESGVQANRFEDYREKATRLPNLQLLEGNVNKSKQATLPSTWLSSRFEVESERTNYRTLHDLGDLPADLAAFDSFYKGRRELLAGKLRKLLVVSAEGIEVVDD